MSRRKSSRKEEVAALVRAAEEKLVVQEPAASPELEEKVEEDEEETSQEIEPTASTAGPKLVGKRRGRAPIEGKSLRRLLIFVSDEDLEKLKEDGRPLSTIGRLAIKEWLEKNRK